MQSSVKVLCITSLAVFVAGIATAAPKKAARNASELVIVNERQIEVTGLEVADQSGKSLVQLAKPLAPGKRTTLKLPKGAGCTFNISVAYADEGETEGATDACKDKTLRLRD